MEFVIERKTLLNAVKEIDRFAPKKSSRPILKCIHIQASDGRVAMTGTDMEIAGRKYVDANVTKQGEVVVSSVRLLRILNTYKDQTVYLHKEDEDLHVVGARTDIKLPGEKVEEFPCFAWPEKGSWIKISGESWHEMVSKTMFATSNERGRYALNGGFLYFDKKSRRLVMVATDGKRLAVIKRPASTKRFLHKKLYEGVILPTRFFLFSNGTSKKTKEVRVAFTRNEEDADEIVSADFGDLQINTRIIEGHFPDYELVIPKEYNTTMIVGIKEFDQSLREAMLATDKESCAVTMSVQVQTVELIIESHSADNGKAEVHLFPEKKIEGKNVRFAVNPTYLLDMLSILKNGNIQIKIKDAVCAMIITPENDMEYKYVCMPVSIGE